MSPTSKQLVMLTSFLRPALLIAALAIVLMPVAGWAHGVGAERDDAVAQVVHFFYIGGDPMAYATVKVFSPSHPNEEYQSLFADADGRVAFVPNENGDWRVVAEDGMGHRSEIAVPHQQETPSSSSTERSSGHAQSGGRAEGVQENEKFSLPTLAWKAVLGVSLLLNLALAARYRLLSRRIVIDKEARHAPQ